MARNPARNRQAAQDPVIALARAFKFTAKRVAETETALADAVSGLPPDHPARAPASVTLVLNGAEASASAAYALIDCFSATDIRRKLKKSGRDAEIGGKVADFATRERDRIAARKSLGLDELDRAYAKSKSAYDAARKRLIATPAKTPAGLLAKLNVMSWLPERQAILQSLRRDLTELARAGKSF
jgi:hypothetical protein